MSDVYLAGSYRDREALQARVVALLNAGVTVSGTWLFGVHENAPPHVCALQDLQEIETAAVVLIDCTGTASTAGGKWVEFGYALGQRKPVVLIGEAIESTRNPFLRLMGVQLFLDWDTCLKNINAFVREVRFLASEKEDDK